MAGLEEENWKWNKRNKLIFHWFWSVKKIIVKKIEKTQIWKVSDTKKECCMSQEVKQVLYIKLNAKFIQRIYAIRK